MQALVGKPTSRLLWDRSHAGAAANVSRVLAFAACPAREAGLTMHHRCLCSRRPQTLQTDTDGERKQAEARRGETRRPDSSKQHGGQTTANEPGSAARQTQSRTSLGRAWAQSARSLAARAVRGACISNGAMHPLPFQSASKHSTSSTPDLRPATDPTGGPPLTPGTWGPRDKDRLLPGRG